MGPTETKSHFAEAKWDCADETSWQHTHSILWLFGRSWQGCASRAGIGRKRKRAWRKGVNHKSKWQNDNHRIVNPVRSHFDLSFLIFSRLKYVNAEIASAVHFEAADRIVNPVTKSPLENHDHCGYNATVDMKIIWIYGCLSTSSHQNMAWRNLTNKILSSIWCFSCWGSILNQIYLMPGERLKPGAQ